MPSVSSAAQRALIHAAWLAFAVAGCGRGHFIADPEVPITSHGVRASVVGARVSTWTVTPSYLIRVSGGALMAARLTDDVLEPCEVPPSAALASISVFSSSAQETVYELEAPKGSAPKAIDVVIDARCLRLPLDDALVRFRRGDATHFLAGASLERVQQPGITALVAFDIGAARWFGPLNIDARFAPGVTSCPVSDCGPGGQQDQGKDSWGFRTSVTARVLPLVGVMRGPTDSIYQALGFGARYAYVWAKAPLLTGERVVTAHLVQGVVTWSVGDVSARRFEDHPEKGATVLFEVPLGASIPAVGPSSHAHFVGGFDLVFSLPL